MDTQKRACAECGVDVADNAPRGLCPRCLLRAGLADGVSIAGSASPEATTVSPFGDPASEGGIPGPQAPRRKADLITVEDKSPPAGSKVHYFGDYELIEEIAHGGMGVVYKARQLSLNRIVALKMILAGRFASDAEVKRFRVEAEAAANLQHPNIVAIHEVGVHEDRHYFSMDYVAGTNLAQLGGGKPLSALQAATLLKAIAGAVHYAHQRGTLHRDLKPQNILIDEQGRPRITDFGLAKRVEQDSSLTRSGAVVGSPSYMPPEQASGRQAELGPHSDVYSLGAILYELLTGRVAFRGETPTATLVQVLEEEPIPLRQWVPGVPVDLETICLKCLEKRPERRYASARALEEELERFLNHEPILARPASRARKGWNWLQRHPWAITGLAVVAIMALACTAYGMWQHSRCLLWQAMHPETVFRIGFQPLLITAWLGLCLATWPCAWADWRLRQYFRHHREQGAPIPRSIICTSILLGLGLGAYALLLVFKQVETLVWRPQQDFHGLGLGLTEASMITVLCWAVSCLWAGATLVWKGVGASELSVFSDLVAESLREADAHEDRLSRVRAMRKGIRERLLPGLILPFWFVLACAIIFFSGAVGASTSDTRPHGLRYAAHLASVCSWLVPAILLPPWRGGEFRSQVSTWRVVAALVVFLGAWLVCSLAVGWFPGLAIALGGGSLGLFLAVAVSWTREVEAQEMPKGTRKPASLLVAGPAGVSVGGIIFFAILTAGIGIATSWTWREASATYVFLDELTASGKTRSRASYAVPQVPDEVNFARTPLLQAIGYRSGFDSNRWARFVVFEPLTVASRESQLKPVAQTESERQNQATEVLRSLAPIEAEFDELRQAAARAFAQIKPATLDSSLQDPNRPRASAFTLLGRLFLVRAAAELELGHSDAALRDLRVVQRLADSLSANRRLEIVLLRGEMALICQEGFRQGLSMGRWTQADLRQWESWLASVELLEGLDCALRGEEPRVINTIFDGPAAGLQSFCILPISADWFRSQRLYNQDLFGYCEAAFDKAKQRVYPAPTRTFLDQVVKSHNEKPRHWQIALFHFPNLNRVMPRTAYIQTMVNMSRVAGALTRHRADAGRFPASLEALAPRYLSRIPHDLVGGKPLVYHLGSDDGFQLYSVGWNEKDDGGKGPGSPSSMDSGDGDWVWLAQAGGNN